MMRLPLHIARRYLFARRSTNAVNIITGVAGLGIAIGSAALILILSVFNGFEDLFLGLYNDFNPDMTITPREGKSFVVDSAQLARLQALPEVELVSQTLEERALFDYRETRHIGMLKGVDANYRLVTGIDSTVREGRYELGGDYQAAVVGGGIRNKLGIDIEDPLASLVIYLPKRKKASIFDTRPFTSRAVQPVGTFLVQQDFEKQYVLTDIALARSLLGRPDAVSAYEVKLAAGYNESATYEKVATLMGDQFVIKNRYEQEASFLRLMRIEKWLSYAIVGLMLLLVSFNMIGALWMIVLEKQGDIAILRSMGMTPGGIYQIFLYEGVLMSVVGIMIGFALALLIYWVQVTFGIITLPGGRLVDAYPVSLRWYDFPVVALTVLCIGTLAAVLPARRAKRVPAIIREE